MDAVILKPGREKSLNRRHPWIFSGAIAKLKGSPGVGDTVLISDHKDRFLAYGAYSPKSKIRIRVWSWDDVDFVPEIIIRNRLQNAIEFRKRLSNYPGSHSESSEGKYLASNLKRSAQRLVHAESDGLPGLIVDRYGQTLVVQILSAGPEHWRDFIIDELVKITGIQDIYERSDVLAREMEGLDLRKGSSCGHPTPINRIEENGLFFDVNIQTGHKTGFYLDQSNNRKRIKDFVLGKDVLDCFCYTGGFTVNALAGGAASVTSVDASGDALIEARKNVLINKLNEDLVSWIEADVFQQLRIFRDQAKKFNLIILDPPKFAPTVSYVKKASRGYKDINLLALKLLRPDGILATFSCSGGLDMALFQKVVADAALDAGVNARIIERLGQNPDHPVALNFPEGSYLKGLIIHKES